VEPADDFIATMPEMSAPELRCVAASSEPSVVQAGAFCNAI
jgi:hypothetical protein